MVQAKQLLELVRENLAKQQLKELPEQLRVELCKQRAKQRRIEVEIEVEVQLEIERKTQLPTQAKTQLTIPVPELLRMLRGMLRETNLAVLLDTQASVAID